MRFRFIKLTNLPIYLAKAVGCLLKKVGIKGLRYQDGWETILYYFSAHSSSKHSSFLNKRTDLSAAQVLVHFLQTSSNITILSLNLTLQLTVNLSLLTTFQAERLALKFKKLLYRYSEGEIPVKDMVYKLMRDTKKADESRLPHICPLEWEFSLSSIFVKAETTSVS